MYQHKETVQQLCELPVTTCTSTSLASQGPWLLILPPRHYKRSWHLQDKELDVLSCGELCTSSPQPSLHPARGTARAQTLQTRRSSAARGPLQLSPGAGRSSTAHTAAAGHSSTGPPAA